MAKTATPTASNGASDHPSFEELLQRARDLVPTLRERSARCEELRQIPPETRDDFVRLGFLRMAQPPRFGGLGYSIPEVTKIALEMGKGCPSTAWMAGQWPGHNFMVGYFSEEAQAEYFAESPDTFSSTSSAIVKVDAEPVKGGMKVSGQLKFSSGLDAADWILLVIPLGMSLVPKSDFVINDDWYTMGLRGTGSKGVTLEDVFIPEHRTLTMQQLSQNGSFGAELYPDNPFYRVPMGLALNSLLVSSVVGIADGLLDIFDERVRKRMDGHTQQAAIQRPGNQLRFAEAAAEVDAAKLLLESLLADLERWGSSGEAMPLEERTRLRRNVGYATKLAVQSGNRLLEAGDASGQYDGQLFQRWGRDLHMAGLQYVLTWDEPAMAYSRVRWGLDPEAFTSM
jgi:alkylation response protein AidB-like acyl-CoA dehydrogenase